MNTIGPRCAADRIYRRETATYTRRTRDCVLVLAKHGTTPLALRGTAIAIWDAFASPRSVSEVARDLAAASGEPLERIEADVQSLAKLLSAHSLLLPCARI
jgi:hypothetical protein